MYNRCAADAHRFRNKPKPIKGEGEDYEIINQSYFTEMNQWRNYLQCIGVLFMSITHVIIEYVVQNAQNRHLIGNNHLT